MKITKIYINSLIKTGNTSLDGKRMTLGLYQFVHDRYTKELLAKKTERGRILVSSSRDQTLLFFNKYSAEQIAGLFELFNRLEETKKMLVNVLNRASALNHFVRTTNGFKVTAPEGFVAINLSGEAVKFVDRLEFSTLNFSPDIVRGWS